MTFRPPKGNFGKRHQLRYSNEPCTYRNYSCSLPCLENYSLCLRHILEDKTAPFKQCNFIYTTTGRRCPLAAPKHDRRDSYCADHLRKVQQKQHRQNGMPQPPVTVERLFSSLSHYVKGHSSNKGQSKIEQEDQSNDNSSVGQDLTSDGSEKDQVTETKSLNPFVDIDANAVNGSLHKVLEYCSESDSDVDITTIDHTTRGKDEDSSDAESVDSAGEDIFRHANTHTAEEVTLRTREKLMRLQALYMEQFARLKHVLRERRRDYLHALLKEKETLCSIASQPRDTIKEQKLYDKLKSLKHYHKRYGVEALMHKKLMDRRAGLGDSGPAKPSSYSKCIFTEGGVKCSLKTIPSAKHCLKHILEDPHQMLFKPCGANKGDATCQEPVMNVFSYENCVYHFCMPPTQWPYNTRMSSEDEEEESGGKGGQGGHGGQEGALPEATVKAEPKLDPGDDLFGAFSGQGDLSQLGMRDKCDTKMRKLSQMDELPLQIMEVKEGSPVRSELEPVFYMAEDYFHEQTVSTEECVANFTPEESTGLGVLDKATT